MEGNTAYSRGRGNRPANAQGHILPRGATANNDAVEFPSLSPVERLNLRSVASAGLQNPLPSAQERQLLAAVELYNQMQELQKLPSLATAIQQMQAHDGHYQFSESMRELGMSPGNSADVLQLKAVGMTDSDLSSYKKAATRQDQALLFPGIGGTQLKLQRKHKAEMVLAAKQQRAFHRAQVAMDVADHPALSQVPLDRTTLQYRDMDDYIAKEAVNRIAMQAYADGKLSPGEAVTDDDIRAQEINDIVKSFSSRKLLPDKDPRDVLSPEAVYLLRKACEEQASASDILSRTLEENQTSDEQQLRIMQEISEHTAEQVVAPVRATKDHNGDVLLTFTAAETPESADYHYRDRTRPRPDREDYHRQTVVLHDSEVQALTAEKIQWMMGNGEGQSEMTVEQADRVLHHTWGHTPEHGYAPEYQWKINPKDSEQVQLSLRFNEQVRAVRAEQQQMVAARKHQCLEASLQAAKDSQTTRPSSLADVSAAYNVVTTASTSPKEQGTLSPDSLVELMEGK